MLNWSIGLGAEEGGGEDKEGLEIMYALVDLWTYGVLELWNYVSTYVICMVFWTYMYALVDLWTYVCMHLKFKIFLKRSLMDPMAAHINMGVCGFGP